MRGVRCEETFRFNHFNQSTLIDSILDLGLNNNTLLGTPSKTSIVLVI